MSEDRMAKTIELLETQLEAAERTSYVDVSGGAKTAYTANGYLYGVAFARGTIEVLPDASVRVTIDSGQQVSEEHVEDVRKLFRYFNEQFIITGLMLTDQSTVAFQTSPFDLETSPYDADSVMRMAMMTIHRYAGVILALDAGTEPWKLMAYDNDDE